MSDLPETTRAGKPAPARRGLLLAAWRVVRLVLVAYLLVVLAMTFLETWLVYPRPPLAWGDWQPPDLGHEEVRFESADGTRLHGWFLPHANARRAILYCHGNGEHLAMNAPLVAELRDSLQASVFIFDYRGYGHSEGSPSEAGCIADGLAAQRWLAEREGVATDEIVLMGRSLGAAVAIALAAEQGAQALVLENAFSRMTDVAAFHYPFLPVRLLMRNRYDSVARIAGYRGPVFQSQAAADEVMPPPLARELFEAVAGSPKRFLELPRARHNDAPPAGYYSELARFLDAIAGRPADAPAPAGPGPPGETGR